MKKLIPILAAAGLLCALTGCTRKAVSQADTAEADALIEQIITYHGQEADEKVDSLLAELKKTDRKKGKLWKNIMDYWEYADTELTVNPDRLPDGLPDDNSLVIAVLGYQLNPDGSMQDELVSRLQVARTCAEQYPQAYVLCTGGGTAANNPHVTEGGQMGEWMLRNGLNKDRLIIEDKSRTTAENACFSYAILQRDYPQVRSAAIVSSSYHIAWGSLLFEAAFLKGASEQNAPEIHVISNSACQIENRNFQQQDILRWETGGMLQMIGIRERAAQVYTGVQIVNDPA